MTALPLPLPKPPSDAHAAVPYTDEPVALLQLDASDPIEAASAVYREVRRGRRVVAVACGGPDAALHLSRALDAIGVLDLVPHTELTVTVEHAAAGRLEHGLRSAGAEITGIDYAARVTVHLLVPTAGRAALGRWLAQFSGGSADLVEGSQSLRAVPPARPDLA